MGKVKAYYLDKESDESLEDIYQSQLHDQSEMIKLIMTLDSLATAFGAKSRQWVEMKDKKAYSLYERIFGE